MARACAASRVIRAGRAPTLSVRRLFFSLGPPRERERELEREFSLSARAVSHTRCPSPFSASLARAQVPLRTSVSAGEGRNIILRNLVGKVAANLNLIIETKSKSGHGPPNTNLQVLDAFADEGHRICAYYLCRAISTAFYEAMPEPVAHKIANTWVKEMNKIDAASNVDHFDEVAMQRDQRSTNISSP